MPTNSKPYEVVVFSDDLGIPSVLDTLAVSSIEEGFDKIAGIYINWELEFVEKTPKGTRLSEFIKNWNKLILNNSCWVSTVNGYGLYDCFSNSYCLPYERCKQARWICWDDLPKDTRNLFIKCLELNDDLEETTSTNVADKLDDGIIAE